jgi:hypothetical protein
LTHLAALSIYALRASVAAIELLLLLLLLRRRLDLFPSLRVLRMHCARLALSRFTSSSSSSSRCYRRLAANLTRRIAS